MRKQHNWMVLGHRSWVCASCGLVRKSHVYVNRRGSTSIEFHYRKGAQAVRHPDSDRLVPSCERPYVEPARDTESKEKRR